MRQLLFLYIPLGRRFASPKRRSLGWEPMFLLTETRPLHIHEFHFETAAFFGEKGNRKGSFSGNAPASGFHHPDKEPEEHKGRNGCGNKIGHRFCQEYGECFVGEESGQNEDQGNQ